MREPEAESDGDYLKVYEKAVIDKEIIIDDRVYHTIKEVKNGMGPAPIKTKKGWLQLGARC